MKFDRETRKNILVVGAALIAIWWGFQNVGAIVRVIGLVLGLMIPFLLGISIAFVLNVPMSAIEKKLFPDPERAGKWKNRLRRPVSLILTLLLVAGIIFIVLFMVIPEIRGTAELVVGPLQNALASAETWLQEQKDRLPIIMDFIENNEVDLDLKKIGQTLLKSFGNGAGDVIDSTIGIAVSVFSGVASFAIGMVFAVYILLAKESLCMQVKKMMHAFLPPKQAAKAIDVGRLTNKAFASFLTGQCTEALILGLMFFVAMTFLRFPYAMVISILIGVASLVPIFGAVAACIVGALLICVNDPIRALWFVVLFLALQQLDGNFIYPKVVGNSVGLPSLWVLFAVTIGGRLLGIIGMLLFIPLFSVIYTLMNHAIEEKLEEKAITEEDIKEEAVRAHEKLQEKENE